MKMLPTPLALVGLVAGTLLAAPSLALAQVSQTTTTTVVAPPIPPPPGLLGPDGQPLPPGGPLGGHGRHGPGEPGMHHGPGGMMRLRLVPLNADLGAYFHTTQGLLVAEAAPGNALGLKAGDVLQAVNGTPVTDPRSVWMAIRAAGGPGATVTLAGLRQGQPLNVRAQLPTREAMMQEASRFRAERQARGWGGSPPGPVPPAPPMPPAPPAPPAPAY